MRGRAGSAILALLISGTTFTGAVAAAQPISTVFPDWSGLDARDYSGDIPRDSGRVIRSVPLSSAIMRADYPNAGQGIRYLYSTPNGAVHRAASTATVILPAAAPPPGGYPVLAWAHGTAGLFDDCAPSAAAMRPNLAFLADFLDRFLDAGYAVVATDYAGLGTPGTPNYLNTTTEGQNVIDSVVAAHALGLPLSGRWAVVGFSQGGGAAIGAGHLASTYRRDAGLAFKGTVSVAGPANIEYALPALGPGMLPFPLDVINARNNYDLGETLAALRDTQPDLNLNTYLTDAGRRWLDKAETTCITSLDGPVDGFTGIVTGAMFTKPLATIPGVVDRLRAYFSSPTTGFTAPVLIVQGAVDTDLPVYGSNLMNVPAMRANGADVRVLFLPQFGVQPTNGHQAALQSSTDDILRFLAGIGL
ncbi:lipase family protein [Nocardia pseudobrasiliensis]|nr:lipase family protein [Nocardia pseudobrasiliensis]